MFELLGWTVGPAALIAVFLALHVSVWRKRAEPLRAALGGWFPFASSTLCFERQGVVFRLERYAGDHGGWNVLTARAAVMSRLMVGRDGSEQYCPLGFPPAPAERVERPGMMLVYGADDAAVRERVHRLLVENKVSLGLLFPSASSAFFINPETHVGAGRVAVLRLMGIPPVVWTAPTTQFLAQVDALLRVAKALELGLQGR